MNIELDEVVVMDVSHAALELELAASGAQGGATTCTVNGTDLVCLGGSFCCASNP